MMARAKPPCGLDGMRQPHQRLDDEDAVADQRSTEDRQYGEDEDGNEDDLFVLQSVKEAELRVIDRYGAEPLRAIHAVIDDRPIDRLEIALV